MKKIWKKITKIISNIGLALFTFGTKVMAIRPLYGIEPIEPKEPTFGEKALPIIKNLFIPLILVIGLIVCWKNKKIKQNTKIYITVGIIILCSIIYVIINSIRNL